MAAGVTDCGDSTPLSIRVSRILTFGLFSMKASWGFLPLRATSWIFLGLLTVWTGLVAQEKRPASHELVKTQVGTLPIILSAPHGGTKAVPDVPERKGEGLERGSTGFRTGRDVGTLELTDAIASAIEKRLEGKPYVVAALFARKYIDANRPPEIAYESPKARPAYDAYHETLAAYCREVKDRYGRGLLLDIHGQSSRPDTIIRGTQNGKTVARLIQRYGEKAHTGPKSFFGVLAAKGAKVHPENGSDPELKDYAGGYIVRTYGSERFGLDAIQLELGSDYRKAEKRAATADMVADATAEYARSYLLSR